MTTHYIDLKMMPDVETSVSHLMEALYGRLHLALVQQRLAAIGISFPGYSVKPRSLGNLLRLHGEPAALTKLMDVDWMRGVRDHVRMTEVTQVPADAGHRVVGRRQFKTNVERLRRRRMRRKSETAEQAAQAIPATVERRPDLPYIHLHSASSGQAFCLFIALGPIQPHATAGAFNSYGLGHTATVPWF